MEAIRKIILVIISFFLSIGISPKAMEVAVAPDSVQTQKQPFVSNVTGGSEKIRIPSIVALDNGRIVCAADARYDISLDGGGLDTIVAYSDDMGENWTSYDVNYLGDNGNKINLESSAFIDPAMVTDGENIWIMTTFFPGGRNVSNWTGIKEARAVDAFDKNGKLRLSSNNGASYGYVADINNFTDGYTPITTKAGYETGFSIDEYFYLYDKDNNLIGNVFYEKSHVKFSVAPTTFLCMKKSTDGGQSFSAPRLINLKKSKEAFFGVGPGKGLCTSDGTLIFSTYTYSVVTTVQEASFIYSKDGGTTWQRAENIKSEDSFQFSGENQIVELPDGTLRCFFRNGCGKLCYVDTDSTEYKWKNVVITDIAINSNCMLSANSYSYEGEDYILISCPTGRTVDEEGNDKMTRTDGKIFAFRLDSKNELNLVKTTEIDSEHFAYSCMDTTIDNKIVMLYEPGDAEITFTVFEGKDLIVK